MLCRHSCFLAGGKALPLEGYLVEGCCIGLFGDTCIWELRDPEGDISLYDTDEAPSSELLE